MTKDFTIQHVKIIPMRIKKFRIWLQVGYNPSFTDFDTAREKIIKENKSLLVWRC